LIGQRDEISLEVVQEVVKSQVPPPAVTEVNIENADLAIYGHLLEYEDVLSALAYHTEF